jgi:tetratricopeptide (TPR) repeat protein
MRKAFLLSKQASEDSNGSDNTGLTQSLFITFVKTCDAFNKLGDIVVFVEENKEIMESRESVEAEIPGLYAEALWSIGRKEEALAAAKRACELISALPPNTMHPEPVAVAYFNLALMQQDLKHTEACIQTYKDAAMICQNSRLHAPNSSADSVTQGETALSNSHAISDDIVAAINTNLASLLMRAEKRVEALSHAKISVDCRERLLKQDPTDFKRRNEYVMAMEALSALQLEMGDSEASRITWEQASLVLEYGGATEGYIQQEIEESRQEVKKEHSTPADVAAVNHRHAKALLACNTPESLKDALSPLTLACETFRQIDDKVSLLDALEDLSNLNEALFHSANKNQEARPSANPGVSFVDEQVAVFGECLALSEALYGAFYRENARYLNNLAIFTFERGENDRAQDLAKAALYVCEKCKLDEGDEIYAHSKTLMLMMGLAHAEKVQYEKLTSAAPSPSTFSSKDTRVSNSTEKSPRKSSSAGQKRR